jgi:hypothetical protein
MPAAKKEIELLLSFVDAKARIASGKSRHILEAELLYPRAGIASKSASMTQQLSSGSLDVRGLPWYRRILFKENVEGRFAIKFRISRSLGQAAFNAAMRYIGSVVFGAVETTVDKHYGGVVGDVASSPFGYGRKQLAKTPSIEYILEGGIDLEASQLNGTMQIEVPLFAPSDVFSPAASHAKGSRPEPRKLLCKEGQLLGKASLTLNVIE